MESPFTITPEPHPETGSVTLMLGGKFDERSIDELGNFITTAKRIHERVFLDLSEVTLMDRKAAEFFSDRAGSTVTLLNCPSYLRRWIRQVEDEPDR